MDTIGMEHFNRILFHKSGTVNKPYTYPSTNVTRILDIYRNNWHDQVTRMDQAENRLNFWPTHQEDEAMWKIKEALKMRLSPIAVTAQKT